MDAVIYPTGPGLNLYVLSNNDQHYSSLSARLVMSILTGVLGDLLRLIKALWVVGRRGGGAGWCGYVQRTHQEPSMVGNVLLLAYGASVAPPTEVADSSLMLEEQKRNAQKRSRILILIDLLPKISPVWPFSPSPPS